MFRKRQEISIHPLDRKKNIYIGVLLPFNGKSVFNFTRTTKDQTKSNIINLLLTNRGERIFNPEFGADVSAFIFEQQTALPELRDIVSDRLSMYIPAITVKSVDVKKEGEYTAILRINYILNNTEDTVQIEFN